MRDDRQWRDRNMTGGSCWAPLCPCRGRATRAAAERDRHRPSVPNAIHTVPHPLSGLAPETPVRAEEKALLVPALEPSPGPEADGYAGSSGRGTPKCRRNGVHRKVVRLSQRARVLVVAHEGQTSHRRVIHERSGHPDVPCVHTCARPAVDARQSTGSSCSLRLHRDQLRLTFGINDLRNSKVDPGRHLST